jgi:glycosyltransferase involved in cell wall biosynthesis
MLRNEKLGVLIPVHNAEETIIRSLESVVQSCTHAKVKTCICLVLNDCIDDTLIKILSYFPANTKQDERSLHVLYSDKGIVPALNKGLQFLSEEGCSLIARQDSDDKWYKTKIIKQLTFLEEHPEIDILGTQINLVKTGTWDSMSVTCNPTEHSEIEQWLLKGHNPIAHPSVMFRTSILNKLGGYQQLFPMAEDLWLWSSAMIAGYKLANLPDVLVDYTSVHNPNYNPMSPRVLSNCVKQIIALNNNEYGTIKK